MMNARELVHGLLTNGRFDRVGHYEYYWDDTLKAWLDQGFPTRLVVEKGEEVVRPEDPNWHFGADMHQAGGWFDYFPLVGYEEILEETDEWKVTRNGAGAAFKFWKDRSGTPEHMDFLMTSREVWERDYRPHVMAVNPARLKLEADREAFAKGQAAGKWNFFGHIFVWEIMRQSMGDLCLYESILLDPGWIHDFNRVYTDMFKAHYEMLFDQVGTPDGIWMYEDLGYKYRLFASPQAFAALIFPYYAEMVEFFHEKGLTVVFHSCGKTTEALPLIVEAGFDALNPMEVKAGNDLFAFAEQYGDRLAFVGGLDVRVLETNDRDVIRREVIQIVEGMKARGARYFFATDHSVTPRVTYDSYRYALEVYREHMMY
jgi:uroporphyrinogen decarboxylase